VFSDREDEIISYTEENKRLLLVIEEAKDTIQQLQDDLENATEKVNELTDQLISTTDGNLLSRYQSTNR
jgi:septal ring factor EnvC (AmiA/AmiB activator)